MERYKKSLAYLERARKVIPGGANTLSKMAARFPEGAFPVALKDGLGANVWDIDDNVYVDWICGLGAVTLGHKPFPFEDDLLHGTMSLPHEIELHVAERLCEKIPCAEMVRFVNSGSEATEAAIRTARIATGRREICTIKKGYHGWFAWFQAVKDWHPGVPREYEDLIHGFEYGDLDSTEDSLIPFVESAVNPKNVAAIILEPCLFDKPPDGYLQRLREKATEWGSLLIFDETVLGFRLALAGGQEYFGVTPDLATFGKGMANGLPIGMLCGRREYMRHAELISGTFGGNTVSLAAADAVLDAYEDEDVIGTMWRRGKELQDFFNATAKVLGVPAVCDGYSCKPRIRFTYDDQNKKDLAMSFFLQETAKRGVLLHPGGLNCCAALTDSDMEITFKGIRQSLDSVKCAAESDEWSELKGKVITPVVTVRQ